MRNDKYWANRMRILEESLLDTGYDYVKNLERQYATAIQDIESQIAKWYQRFATENGITLAEANKLLTTQELDEFTVKRTQSLRRGISSLKTLLPAFMYRGLIVSGYSSRRKPRLYTEPRRSCLRLLLRKFMNAVITIQPLSCKRVSESAGPFTV